MRWLLLSQNIFLFGAGLVFPFYVIFIRGAGANFTEFGIAYALFSLSGACIHHVIGRLSDRKGPKVFLLLSSWGTAVTMLFFPIVTSIQQVYILQVILGLFGAMQKTSEKTLVGDFTDGDLRGTKIGRYHAWTSIASGLAVIAAGYIIDLFTIEVIFYIGSLVMFVSGFAVFFIHKPHVRA